MCCQLKMQGSEQQRLNISHTPRFFSWAQIHSCPFLAPLPWGVQGTRDCAQSLPTPPCCSIFHTLFPCSRVGSLPRATVLQDKSAARGAAVFAGNTHMPQCRSCKDQCGSLLWPSPLQGLQDSPCSITVLPRAAGESLLWCLQCFLPFSSDLAAHRVFPTPLCSILPLETQACSFTTARPRDTHLPAPWATFPAAWETQAILLLWSSAGRKVKTRSLCTQGHLPAAIELHPDVGEDPAVGEDLTVRNSNWVASTGLWGFTLWDPRAQTLGGAAEARGLL